MKSPSAPQRQPGCFINGSQAAANDAKATQPVPLWTVSNLYTAFDELSRVRDTATALDCGAAGCLTYAQLRQRAEQFAGSLAGAGVGKADRVLVQLDKHVDCVALYLAVLRLGAVYVPLNTSYTAAEVDYFLGDAQPRVALIDASRQTAVGELSGADGVTLWSLEDLHDAAPTATDACVLDDSDLAAILYTSGTTGRSKGAMLTHGNLTSNARTLIEAWGFTADDVLLHMLPIYHVHGLFVALHCALLSGATVRFEDRFDARRAVELLPSATVFMGVPTYYSRLLEQAHFPAPGDQPRLYISGSAPLRTETFDAFETRTGQRILERYGMTEAGMICSNPLRGQRLAGTVGAPLTGVDVRCTEGSDAADATEETADLTPGVLEIKGPNVFVGYWRNREKTAEAFTPDGYFITGDIATLTPDGVVSIIGRDKDLIISGGLNVYPKEVEIELDAIDGVNESAVIGVQHPDLGEAVVAVVDFAAATAETPDEANLIAALKGRLAGFKVPKRVLAIDQLPRNAMGKVQKNLLRDRHAGLFEQ